MPTTRPLLMSALISLPVFVAGCGGVVAQGIRDGDTACSRPTGTEGGCQRVPSSDSYEKERQQIRENRKGEIAE